MLICRASFRVPSQVFLQPVTNTQPVTKAAGLTAAGLTIPI